MSRAAKDRQWGRMRPAGRQFDMPVLDLKILRLLWLKVLFEADIIKM